MEAEMDTNFYLWTIIFIQGQEFLFGEKEQYYAKVIQSV